MQRKEVLAAGIAAALILVAVTAWWAYTRENTTVDAGEASTMSSDGSVLLSQAQLHAQGIETTVVSAASDLPVPGLPAEAVAPLDASAQVVVPYAGVLTRILVDEGTTVRKGQPLVRIQSRELLAAQAELARARSEATAAALQAKRDAALLAEGIIAASRNEQAQARNAAAQGALRQADGAMAQLRIVTDGQAGEYELLAPMAGQVIRRHVIPGQAVAALDRVFVIAEPGRIDVIVSAPLRLREAVTPGLAVHLPGGATARVVAVGADADPASQSLRLRARIDPDPAARLTAGQQFSVTLLLPAPEGALAVPPSALLPSGEAHVLYTMDAANAEGSARIRAVTVRLLGGDASRSIVTPVTSETGATLAPGTQVVSRGTALLKAMIPLE
jgi:RND family efflux transporter MFP subunit